MSFKIEYVSPQTLVAYENNSRTHSEIQIDQIKESIKEFGFVNPILIGKGNVVIAGHGRLEASIELQLELVPIIRLNHLSERQIRALVIADNKIASNAGWDFDKLGSELSDLIEYDFNLELTGFNEQEIDALLKNDKSILPFDLEVPETIEVSNHTRKISEKNIDNSTLKNVLVSREGNVWLIGNHRIECGEFSTSKDRLSIDLLVDTWQNSTGKKAVLESSGKRFNTIKKSIIE